ncbi:MAG: hypothetical protein NTW21_41480 [Verrucomicrobia bacterium]|nr:hypothetical protein [Verrucomicrobiota bacterium]
MNPISPCMMITAAVAALASPLRAQEAPTVLGRHVHVTLVGRPREPT